MPAAAQNGAGDGGYGDGGQPSVREAFDDEGCRRAFVPPSACVSGAHVVEEVFGSSTSTDARWWLTAARARARAGRAQAAVRAALGLGERVGGRHEWCRPAARGLGVLGRSPRAL